MLNKLYLSFPLYNSYGKFCSKQENCHECNLYKFELIEQGYDQNCESVYDLLTEIKKLRKEREI